MAHISLYRKYRPATFDEVVGQEHVTRTLKNAIESEKISHAYLFAGSRGTGKTSVAKLLAKALNCVNGPTASPCGECESCTTIAAGTSLDVIEMDAASNRGIDDIRDIRDKVAFSPVEGRSRVYILDEAHMLTKEASNAFLKVLEEPPGHVIFVLCTTEAHKVLPTIQSRCQRFEFRRPDVEMVLSVLRRIAAAEEIAIDEAGLAVIARSAGGSFRDAVGALDQIATYSDGPITYDDVLSMLGAIEIDLLFEAVDIVADGDARGALLFVNRLAESGRDYAQFAAELTGHLRNIFLLQQIDDYPAGIINVPEEDLTRLKAQARVVTPAQVFRFVELLGRAQTAMKQGDDPRLQLELALLGMAKPQVDHATKSLLYRLEKLEESLAGAGGNKPVAPVKAAVSPDDSNQTTPEDVTAPVQDAEPDNQEEEETDAGSAIEVSLERIQRAWSIILTQVKKRKVPLYSLLKEARPLELNGDTLVVGFPVGADFHKSQAAKSDNAAILAEVLGEMAGRAMKVEFAVSEGARHESEEPPSHEDIIAMVKETFKAEEVEGEPNLKGEDFAEHEL